MKVSNLIEKLSSLPPEADVGYVWDGEVRSYVSHVWLARDGSVVLADYGDVLYDGDKRPADAPTESENRYWETPEEPIPNEPDSG